MEGLFVRNIFRIPVNQNCASCAFREATTSEKKRYCTNYDMTVEPHDVCCCWRMRQTLRLAGSGRGHVKRIEYLKFLMFVREDESQRRQAGELLPPKPISDIRREFEEQFGSIFSNY